METTTKITAVEKPVSQVPVFNNNVFAYQLFRDELVLDASLSTNIMRIIGDAKTYERPVRHVLLAARKVRVAKGLLPFWLKDCDLTICADEFVHEGMIWLDCQVNAMGANGHTGRTLTIFCKTYTPDSGFRLKGGTGGKGNTGIKGVKGKDGTLANPHGMVGGKGRTGLQGRPGGRGGSLNVYYLTAVKTPASLNKLVVVPGGDGGIGGEGGQGGDGGKGITKLVNGELIEGKDGPRGAKGTKGTAGISGSGGLINIMKSSSSEGQFLTMMMQLSSASKEWSAQRAKQAEYLLHLDGTFRQRAYEEIEEALKLDPTNIHAQQLKKMIFNKINVIGFNRYMDVIPDFPAYEKSYLQYQPFVNNLFDVTDRLLQSELNSAERTQELSRALDQSQKLVAILDDEYGAASLEFNKAKQTESNLKSKFNDIRTKLETRKEQIRHEGADPFGKIITFISAAVSLGVAVYTGGASLIAGFSAFGVIAKTLNDVHVDDLMDEFKNEDKEQPILDKLKEESKGLVEAVQSVNKSVISFQKALEEIDREYDDDEVYRNLMKEMVEVSHQILLAEMQTKVVTFKLQAAEKRKFAANQDVDTLEQYLSENKTGQTLFANAAFRMMKMMGTYLRIMNEFKFKAARALEIYTYKDQSNYLHFSWGVMPPDVEANHADAQQQGRNDVAVLAEQLVAWREAWVKEMDILAFGVQYKNFMEVSAPGSYSYGSERYRYAIKDAATLDKFKLNPKLSFSVTLNDIPSNRYSAKVKGVWVALIGAQSAANEVTVCVTHGGHYAEKDIHHQIHEFSLQPRIDLVMARHQPLYGREGAPKTSEGSFLNRGIATNWEIAIQQDIFNQSDADGNLMVDLTGLSEIQVWIEYQCFFKNQMNAAKSSQLKSEGSFLMDQESGDAFLVRDGAKYLIDKALVSSERLVPVSGETLLAIPFGKQPFRMTNKTSSNKSIMNE